VPVAPCCTCRADGTHSCARCRRHLRSPRGGLPKARQRRVRAPPSLHAQPMPLARLMHALCALRSEAADCFVSPASKFAAAAFTTPLLRTRCGSASTPHSASRSAVRPLCSHDHVVCALDECMFDTSTVQAWKIGKRGAGGEVGRRFCRECAVPPS
jgi:hypothetical protein